MQNGHHHHHDSHHHDDHGSRDLHLWLNPDNGLRVVEALAVRMGLALSSDVAALRALVAELENQLKPARSRKFAVYHNGYGHFTNRFALQAPYVVTETPEQRPGARHLHQLRQQLPDAACLLVEPSSHNSLSRQLSQHASLNVVNLIHWALSLKAIKGYCPVWQQHLFNVRVKSRGRNGRQKKTLYRISK